MLIVVTGPPCSGKTTHVATHRSPLDMVIDLDALAQSLGYPASQVEWGDPHPAVDAARLARRHLIEHARQATNATTWLIDAQPNLTTRRIHKRCGATFIALDPGRDESRARASASDRSRQTLDRIDAWYAARN